MKNLNLANKKLILLFVVCLLFSIAFAIILTSQPSVLIRSDHFSRWYAVNKLITEHRSIYDPENGKEIVALNSIPVDPIEGSFFYPAHLMVFFLPIARLPYPLAHFIWIIVIQLFLVMAAFLMYKEINWPPNINQFTLIVMLSILFIPNLQNTIWGQYNTIGLLSLVLVFIMLRRENYFLSGLLSIGLTFKPQNYLLTLLFLFFWVLLQRKRWNFILGFVICCFVFWGFAEYYEPYWIISFLHGVQKYNAYLQPRAVLVYHQLWNVLLISLLAVIFGWLIVKNHRSDANSGFFAGCLGLSIGIWWIIVPVIGMMQLVSLPIIIMMLFSFLELHNKKVFQFGIVGFLVLYGLGVIGFIYGLSNPESYGIHIQFAELAYKVLMPFLIIALSIPLCISKPLIENEV